ncbi:AMP-binding protein, partial [Arthrospira platensis SPKY1]|nr:AMP-binding protein [Arthrospira platensis SPKY1]
MASLFLSRVGKYSSLVAMRENDLGIWKEITWQEYGIRAQEVAAALRALACNRGDVISIISENCPEWLFADMGAQLVGCIANGIYPTDSAEQLQYILNDSSTKVIFVENN